MLIVWGTGDGDEGAPVNRSYSHSCSCNIELLERSRIIGGRGRACFIGGYIPDSYILTGTGPNVCSV